jgi:type I restriction enzyme S subunit
MIDLEHAGPWGEITENSVETLGSSRLKFNADEIITTKLRPYLQKTVLLPAGRLWHGSPEWLSLKVNPHLLRPKLLFYILQNKSYTRLAPYFATGKEHPRISLETLQRLTIPQIDLSQQDELIKELDELLEEAIAARAKISKVREAIDPYLERHFGLVPKDISSQRETKFLRVPMSQIADSRDARFSYRYHSESVVTARRQLAALSRHRLRELLVESAVLGDSISPDDYSSSTGYTYASMVSVKRWRFETSELNDVSEEYFKLHAHKKLREGDVVMARSGEGTIGKVGWVNEPVHSVCADFLIRMRPDPQKLDPGFLYFLLMSSYYQQLIYGEKKGLGNNTNIFPNQLHNFPIIDVSIYQQREMVDELKDFLAESDASLRTAQSLEDKIDTRVRTYFSG